MAETKIQKRAIVGGNSRDGKRFEHEFLFELLPPAKGENHYGTGCYMNCWMIDPKDDEPWQVDVRYEGTTDLEKLATDWALNNFTNTTDVKFID